MTSGHSGQALIRHHLATIKAKRGAVTADERVESSRWLLEMLRQQLKAGRVSEELGRHFGMVFRCILEGDPAAAGELLGIVGRRGAPTTRNHDHHGMAVAVEWQVRVGDTIGEACEHVAGSRTGWHVTSAALKRIYYANKTAAKADVSMVLDDHVRRRNQRVEP